VYLYEDDLLQSLIVSLLPPEVTEAKDQVQQLKALLKWFKYEFFTWCDKPKCPKCGLNDMVNGGVSLLPTHKENFEGHARAVEGY